MKQPQGKGRGKGNRDGLLNSYVLWTRLNKEGRRKTQRVAVEESYLVWSAEPKAQDGVIALLLWFSENRQYGGWGAGEE